MSGGHYDYLQFRISEVASRIQADLDNDFRYEDYDYTIHISEYSNEARPTKMFDMLQCSDEDQRQLIIADIKQLILILNSASDRVHKLDYLLSGDSNAQTYTTELLHRLANS